MVNVGSFPGVLAGGAPRGGAAGAAGFAGVLCTSRAATISAAGCMHTTIRRRCSAGCGGTRIKRARPRGRSWRGALALGAGPGDYSPFERVPSTIRVTVCRNSTSTRLMATMAMKLATKALVAARPTPSAPAPQVNPL